MKKLLTSLALVAAAPMVFAQANNVGSCGLGSKVFQGQRGIAPQVLAATTNGTFGNQTFGITFGTLGCTPDGVVSSNWKTAMFIDGNRLALTRDAAAGQGEALDGLMAVMNVSEVDRGHFVQTIKAQYGTVFGGDAIAQNLRSMLLADSRLAVYAQSI